MKNIFIIILFFLTNTLSAQYVVDSPGAIYWDDPVYNDFFNESCSPQNLEKSATVATRTIVRYYQNDPRWDGAYYGNCTTIGDEGCYLT